MKRIGERMASILAAGIWLLLASAWQPAKIELAQVGVSWANTGGPLGGLGYDVRMRPDNPDIMFVTDAWAGVFTSQDGGASWRPTNQGITTRAGEAGDAIPVFSLTIDPHNPDILWIGTQFQRGIFKSTDGGATWKKLDQGVGEREGITFRGFTVDPNSSEIVYAAAEISSWAWSGQEKQGREFDLVKGVVYQTRDGGRSWKAIWRGDNLARYVWVDPRNAQVIYISTGIFDREAANSDPQAGLPGGEGVVKSVDGGLTWEQANHGLNNLYVGSLFMHPQNPEVLLAGTGNNQYFAEAGVYLSLDGGKNWEHTLKEDVITAVEISASDPQVAYAGSASTIYRSQDGGRTWQRQSSYMWGPPGVAAGFPIDFQVDPRNPDRIFANEYGGGNFLSQDGGKSWSVASQGYTGAQVRHVTLDAVGRLYAAARSGLFASGDGGKEWMGLAFPPVTALEWTAVAADPRQDQHILAATNWNSRLMESLDGGYSWREAINLGEQRMGWRAIEFSMSDPQVVYAATKGFYSAGSFSDEMPGRGLFVSLDGGATWEEANDDSTRASNLNGFAIHPADSRMVYLATSSQGLLKTSDGGASWTPLNQGLGGNPLVAAVEINPAEPNYLILGMRRGGIYRSENGGQSWQRASAGLNPEANISDILFDPRNPQVAYAADLRSGVYQSDDGGRRWKALNAGLTTRMVNSLAFSPDGGHLYAATEGGGVFRLDMNGQPPAPVALFPAPLPPTQPAPPTQPPAPTASRPPVAEPTATSTAQPEKPGTSLPCSLNLAFPAMLVGAIWINKKRRRK